MERIFNGRRGKRSGRGYFDSCSFNRSGCNFPKTAAGAGKRSDEFSGEKSKSCAVTAKRQEASVTVPLCIALTILAVLILGLVEGARFYGLRTDAKEWAELTTESLFAGYQPFLFETYDMFFLDGHFGGGSWNLAAAEDEMEALINESVLASGPNEGSCFYRMGVSNVEITRYRLAADEAGNVFEMQAAEAMKQRIGKQAAEKLLGQIKDVEKKEAEGGDPEKSIADANTVLEELANAAQTESEGQTQDTQETNTQEITLPKTEVKENPLDTIKTIRSQGILALTLPKGKTVSAKTISVDNCMTKRNCRKGNYKQAKSPGWYERILMQEFIKSFAGNAVSPNEKGVLSYGLEYVICGKGSDEENLKGTVNRLLLLREGANFVYLQSDKAKQAEAMTAATVFAGIAANPAAVPLIQQGILAAWAYVESICDIKALLSGGKVPLVKDAASWKTDLSKLVESVQAEYGGETRGLTYENYLDALLYGKTVKQAAYRTMDLMEKSMQKRNEYAKCRLDEMIVGIRAEVELEADTLFLGIFGEDPAGGYHFLEKTEYAYGE